VPKRPFRHADHTRSFRLLSRARETGSEESAFKVRLRDAVVVGTGFADTRVSRR